MINLMVDIETTGVNGHKNAILQIGAVPFDLGILGIGQNGFKMSLTMPSDRTWMDSTKKWWEETNPTVLKKIQSEAINFAVVLAKFKKYVESFNGDVLFWSNHPFDWLFIEDYFEEYGIKSPFKYDSFRDVDSYIAALVGEANLFKYKPEADKVQEHDALYDCLLQVDWLFNSIKNKG